MPDDDYLKALDKDSRDLVEAARKGELPRVAFRDEEVARVLELLAHGDSVLLVGRQGAGKTAVVHGVAYAMQRRGVQGLRELSTTAMMVGTRYIGEWQTKVVRVAEAAEKQSAVLCFSDIWNLAHVGKTSNNKANLLDALRPFLQAGRVRLLGEVTAETLRKMERTPGFATLFTQVEVHPLPPERVDALLESVGVRLGLTLDQACRAALVKLTSRFLASRPQPGPALGLLRQVRDYQEQKESVGESEPLDPAFIEKVFSIYSGLPRFVVSRQATMAARDIRSWFQERIVGQEEAIDAVLQAIALFKAGLHDPTKPIGTFLFVGPTGVGKTELARTLARFLFGSPKRLLRFDLSEFKDYHSFELLLGASQNQGRPARLIDPVRAQPFQVVLFDELEKAHPNLWDLFLQLLDDGRLTPPRGEAVSFRNTMVIATSNVGSDQAFSTVGFGSQSGAADQSDAIRRALEQSFRPEFLNRFQHVVVFRALTPEQLRRIARHELQRVLRREGIAERNLVVDVDDSVLDLVIERGYDPRYGARALKREIQRQLVLPLAMTLMEREVEPGSILRVADRRGKLRVRVLDTQASRSRRRQREPVQPAPGRKLTRAQVLEGVTAVQQDMELLAEQLDATGLEAQRNQLEQLRAQPSFWQEPSKAALALRDLDRCARWLERLESLRDAAEDLATTPLPPDQRTALERLARRLLRLERRVASARRELVFMGLPGHWDALLELQPLGQGGRLARDLLLDTYLAWAGWRGMSVEWFFEPMVDDEPVLLALQGHCAAGYLGLEAGLHRVREADRNGVVRVRVVPWIDQQERPRVLAQRALKARGQRDGRVRSRLECEGGLVLQNARTLQQNLDLAGELLPSWRQAAAAPELIVRRYHLTPFKLRDLLTGQVLGRPDVLKPQGLHELLCQRLDLQGAREEPADK